MRFANNSRVVKKKWMIDKGNFVSFYRWEGFVCCDDRRSFVSVFLSFAVLIPFDVSKVSGLMGLGRLFCARVGERNFRFEGM